MQQNSNQLHFRFSGFAVFVGVVSHRSNFFCSALVQPEAM